MVLWHVGVGRCAEQGLKSEGSVGRDERRLSREA